MQDAAPNPQFRIRWKFYQLAVMLVPGVIFLANYPAQYRTELVRAEEAL